MTDLTPVPKLDTWIDGISPSADQLNANVRDPQLFLAQAPITIATRAASQTVTSGSNQVITFDTEVVDVDGMFSAPSTNLNVKRPGVYLIQFQSAMAANTTGIRAAFIYLNDEAIAQSTKNPSGTQTCLTVSVVVPLKTGDKLNAYVYQDSGGDLNCGGNATEGGPRLAVRLVSAADVTILYDGDGGETEQPPTPPPSDPGTETPTHYNTVFHCTWSRSFQQNNQPRWNDPSVMYEGSDQGLSDQGNQKSLCGFNYSSIKSTLAGATNITVWFEFYCIHTWYYSGGSMQVDVASFTSKPATYDSSRVKAVATVNVKRNTHYKVQLPSYCGTKFQVGNYTAMGFGPAPSSSASWYGYNAGYGDAGAPLLRFDYWK